MDDPLSIELEPQSISIGKNPSRRLCASFHIKKITSVKETEK